MSTMKLGILVLVLSVGLTGCAVEGGADDSEGASILQQAVSECGGFPSEEEPRGEAESYCDAERLHWRYDAESGELTLVNTRVLLNCCSERSVWAEIVDGVLIVTEVDDVAVPCRCMCTFDFSITVDGIAEGPLAVELLRSADDPAGGEPIWSGTLELGDGAGSEVIDDADVGSFCD